MHQEIHRVDYRHDRRAKEIPSYHARYYNILPFHMRILYTLPMSKKVSGGVAHGLPADLRRALGADPKALAAWEDITPLARNEWICWVVSLKTPEKRKEHVDRTVSELKEGMRRPCCWYGCVHRKDKALSASQRFVLSRRTKKKK